MHMATSSFALFGTLAMVGACSTSSTAAPSDAGSDESNVEDP